MNNPISWKERFDEKYNDLSVDIEFEWGIESENMKKFNSIPDFFSSELKNLAREVRWMNIDREVSAKYYTGYASAYNQAVEDIAKLIENY
jgi:hypothetical protein